MNLNISYYSSGWGSKSLKTRRLLLDKFPEELSLWNEFGVGALTIGRVEDARQAFQGVRSLSLAKQLYFTVDNITIKRTLSPVNKRGLDDHIAKYFDFSMAVRVHLHERESEIYL